MTVQHASYKTENNTAIGLVENDFRTGELIREMKTQLQLLLSKSGPELTDYKLLDKGMSTLYQCLQLGMIMPQDLNELKDLFSDDFLQETIHGYGLRKPMGYAGDFLLIDKIYTHHKTDHPTYRNWDNYFHCNEATDAVRNRKEYFKKQMLQKVNATSQPLNLLNVASGPARDLHELYQTIDGQTLNSTCVDMDARALDYAKDVCKDEMDSIHFIHKNILRFSTTEKFDVIWSAGLFDYFDEKIFVLAMKKFLSWLKPGGEIIVGNFSEDNSSRGYMEMFGEWMLIHRSAEKLIQLAVLAGAKEENIWVDQEPLGINLFLRITA